MQELRSDIVVVGGGTAGSVLAARLSAEDDRDVLVLEAGPVELPQTAALLDARMIPGARRQSAWSFPGAIAIDREWTHVRGRVIGGSSTTNGGYFIPAGPEDIHEWTVRSGGAWSWKRVRATQLSIENDLDFTESALHGHTGPISISRAPSADPQIAAFADSAAATGIRIDIDKGADWADGFGLTPSNRRGSVRVNTALAYLTPVLRRPNLRIKGNATVHGVRMHGHRATGVDALIDGVLTRVTAGEVVLATGALRTPDLLSLAGIRLPGLGEQMHDDPQIILEVSGWPMSETNLDTWLGGVVHASLPDGSTVEMLQSLQPLAKIAGLAGKGALSPLFVSVSSAEPTGRLRRISSDPMTPARVEFDHLATEAARGRLRAAVRLTADLVQAGIGTLVSIDPATLASDAALDRWVRAHLGTAFHTTGGAGLGDVVDSYGRVHDTQGLRVADLSVLPAGVSRGPAATAVLVGELLAPR